MKVTGWKSADTYGVRIGAANAARYFDERWKSVEVEIDGALHHYELHNKFWTKSAELLGGIFNTWLLERNLAPWPWRRPPKLLLTPLGSNRFRLSIPKTTSDVSMGRDDIARILCSTIDTAVTITFADGIVLTAVPLSVDDEGVAYNLQEDGVTVGYWTRFDDIIAVHSDNPETQR